MRKPSKTAAVKAAMKALVIAKSSRPVPPPKPAGFIVTHADSRPLTHSLLDNRSVLLIGDDEEGGSIFPTWEAAFKAVESSIRYEITNGLRWSQMYGPSFIVPVYAA
jgi:hypothetical protein